MNKKSLTILVAMLLAGTNAFAEAVEIDGIWYNLVSKAKVAEVTYYPSLDLASWYPGTSNNFYTDAIVIPEMVTYNEVDYQVTGIGSDAFHGSSITSITIPNTVKSIGRQAFIYCYSLTSVIIPNSVTSMGGGAFWECTKLTSVTISNNVTSLWYTFQDCSSLTSVRIPNSVTRIRERSFSHCI